MSSLDRTDCQRHAVPNKSKGTTYVTYCADATYGACDLAAVLPVRSKMLQDIAKLPHTTNRRPRASVALEAAGATALGMPDQELIPKRPWIARIYYRAESDSAHPDGEQLYAEFGGLTEAGAGSVLLSCGGGQSWPLLKPAHDCPACSGQGRTYTEGETVTEGTGRRRREWKRPDTWADCAKCEGRKRLDGPPPAREGCRLVEWPSELDRRARRSAELRASLIDQPDLLARLPAEVAHAPGEE